MGSLELAKYPLAYCTNVHAGASFEQTMEQLQRYVPAVRNHRNCSGPMGIGLWFSHASVNEALTGSQWVRLARWLQEHQLLPFTFNAFPQHDFHRPVVKHDVYRPTWADPSRKEYTQQVFRLQHQLLPPAVEASVSTVPLGWPDPGVDEAFHRRCASQLWEMVEFLEQLEWSSGRLAYLCVEPEPGCLLSDSKDLSHWFERWLLKDNSNASRMRRYLRVCHDVCHSAVLFENQSTALNNYRQLGLHVGKVQISAALTADCSGELGLSAGAILDALTKFREPRYLHQTVVRSPGGETQFFEDLNLAFEARAHNPSGEWRVHFHVPIFLDQLGLLRTTQSEIDSLISEIAALKETKHFEVETYAWSVLPEDCSVTELSAGIAREMDWFAHRYLGETNSNRTNE